MPAESLSVAGTSAGSGVALALRPPPPLSRPRPRPTLQPSGSDARCLRQAVFNGLLTGQAHCETFENRKTHRRERRSRLVSCPRTSMSSRGRVHLQRGPKGLALGISAICPFGDFSNFHQIIENKV